MSEIRFGAAVGLLVGTVVFTSSSAVPMSSCITATGPTTQLANPILFVTQVPVPQDFATIGSVFANHRATLQSAPRGGDLWELFPDGTLCNLTAAGGFGMDGMQGADGIAVRDPDVHYAGDRALFSMVVGAPEQQFQVIDERWQIYEITGLALGTAVTITAVPGQPTDANNIMPIYAPDDSIVFVSDRPHNGQPHLYPPLDEYESTPTPSGLWHLDGTELTLMQHSPSGSFDPLVDSAGRVVFTRWDHLQRDQQGDSPDEEQPFQPIDYASESPGAAALSSLTEVFPEPRPVPELVAGTNFVGHRFNHFFPWMINLDGTEEETLNHVGRHELHFYFAQSFNDDPALIEFIDSVSGRTNPNDVFNLLQMAEDPQTPGRFVAVDAPEFQTHAAGQIFAFTAAPNTNPDDIVVEYLTHPDTETVDSSPGPDHSGHYRNPVPLSNGVLIASHTSETGAAANLGTGTNPVPAYDFQIKPLATAPNTFLEAGASLTGGIVETVSWFDPDTLITYSGPLWELNATEVVVRTVPPVSSEPALAQPEQNVFDNAGVDVNEFRTYLRNNNLALMVARNVTTRDDADKQQPYNLRVPGGVQTVGSGGQLYDVDHLQYVQGDMIRGYGIRDGRRILPRFLHDPNVLDANPPAPGAPEGGVPVFPDGSVAAFVPVQRAMAWQLTAPDDTPVVRERVWITFQPGEIRVCDGCHGVNKVNQAGSGPALNEAEALEALLGYWQTVLSNVLHKDGFEGF